MSNFGDLLREARDAKGVTLREAERATRIRRAYLSALESQLFADLPPAAYARGIVRNYAQYLGLDPAATLAEFEQASGAEAGSFAIVPATRPMDSQSHWAPNFAIIAFMIVMAAVVFTWMYSAYFQPSESLATTTVGVATVTPVSPSILAVTSPQVTVATQGGGFATATPTSTVTPSPSTDGASGGSGSVATEATEVVEPDTAATEPLVVEPESTEPAVEATAAEAIGVGSHTFVVAALEEVWVQVILNGESTPAFDGVLPAGTERIFYGDAVIISSGNSAYVQLWVDGDDYGPLGDSWDESFVYP